MAFLRNAWYVATWDDEVRATGRFRRRILDKEIRPFRDAGGRVHAHKDRRLHRFAPLHQGQRQADVMECAYHGLRFGLDGRCVHNPHGDGAIPVGAATPTYPLIAKRMLLWILMGDSRAADAASLPSFEGLDPERYAINKGYMQTPSHYEYMTDNSGDLGHIELLHRGLLGSEAVWRADTEVREEGRTVFSNRLTHAKLGRGASSRKLIHDEQSVGHE